MTLTTDLDFLIIEENQNSKEVVVNNNMILLDGNLAATLDIDTVAGGTIAITLLQFQGNARLRLTGGPSADFILELPEIKGSLSVSNESGKVATVRVTATPGNTVDIDTGSTKLLYNTGTIGQNLISLGSDVASASDWKESVRVATTANITLSGAQTIDGASAIAGDRVLVKDQSTGSENGIYIVDASTWSRSIDADIDAEVTSGLAVVVNEGTANGDKAFVLVTNDPITVDTTILVFSGISAAGITTDSVDVIGTEGSTSPTTGSIKTAGGFGIAENVFTGGDIEQQTLLGPIHNLHCTDTSLVDDQLIGGYIFEKDDVSGAGAGIVGGLRMLSDDSVGLSTYITLSTSDGTTNDNEVLRLDSAKNATFEKNVSIKGFVVHANRSAVTISAGSIVVTKSLHQVDTEAAAATDDLDNITTTSILDGTRLILSAADNTHTVVIKDGIGNLRTAGDFVIDTVDKTIELILIGSTWKELSRSAN